MINVNDNSGAEVLKKCRPLREYAWFVDQIRIRQAEMTMDESINRTIKEMPANYELKPFLVRHIAEVMGMFIEDYTEEEIRELFKEDGKREGILSALLGLVSDGILTIAQAAQRAGMTEAEFRKHMSASR